MSVSKLLLLFFFTLVVMPLCGQGNQPVLDSLKAICKTSPLEQDKASAFIMLGDLYYSSYADSALIFLEEGMEIAKKINDEDLQARCFLIMGSAYWAKDEDLKALEYNLLAEEKYQKLSDKTGLTRCYMNIGYLNHELGNTNEAMEITQRGLRLAESMEVKDSIRIAGFYQNLGLFSEKAENYPQALTYYLASLKIKEQVDRIDVKRSMPKTLDGIAGVYNFMKQYESAYAFYEKGMKIREELNDIGGMFISSYNIGVVYQGLGKFEAAREYYNKALVLAERLNSMGAYAYCYDAFGDLEKKAKNYPLAVEYIRKSLDIRKKKPNTDTYAHTLSNLSGAYHKWGKPYKALRYAKKFDEVQEFATLEDQAEVRNIQSEVWEMQYQFKKSLSYLKMANVLEDSLTKIAEKQNLEELKAKYEKNLNKEKFEKKILKQDAKIKSNEAKANAKLFRLQSIAFVIVAFLVALLFRSNRKRKKANIELAENNIELHSVNRQLGVVNNSLKQFTFAASHDLKESLRSVISFSQVLIAKVKKGGKDEDVDAKIGFIVNSGKRMHKTLDDLLEYADINMPKEDLAVIDFSKIIKEVKANVFGNNEVDIIWSCNGEVGELKGYPTLLKQLIGNLFDNAKKFTSDQEDLKILVTGQRISNNECLIAVKDNGKGIEPEYLDYIFEPFKRLNNRDLSGSGLGLSVCKKIVEMHGGKIWAASVVGEGTTIFFTMVNTME